MKYPDWLKKGDIIGCTAPSDGVKKAVNFMFTAFIISFYFV